MQGWRLEMEDAHICKELPSKLDHTLLAVFDGHGGSGAAIWVAQKLIYILENNNEWKEYLKNEEENPQLVGKAMRHAFLDADELLRAFQEEGGPGADTSGCTSVVCIITPKHIICANAGDSRCVLGTNGGVIPMSFDHKPYDTLERERIENAGGTVQWKRVDGDLAVSRALGDFQFKTSSTLPPEQQKVSPEPDIIVHERVDTSDEFLLLACDGLWDVMSNPEATDIGRSLFNLGESNMMLFAEEMIDIALDKGSRDNISAVAMKLPGAKISTDGGGVQALRNERQERAAEDLRKKEAATARR
jgi:serine/threonine protein phosphatase PrpC